MIFCTDEFDLKKKRDAEEMELCFHPETAYFYVEEIRQRRKRGKEMDII